MHLPRVQLLILLLLVLPFITKGQGKPNVILIITDDISWNDLGTYGNKFVRTPSIDSLAETGVVFNEAYTVTSSCSPSRCSMITGRYPHNTGAPELHDPLPKDQVMFPKLLREAGYYTALSGKNHMGPNVRDAFDTVSLGQGPGGQQDWVELVQKRPRDKPFFFWFASHDAHRDWQYDEHGSTIAPEDISVPPMFFDGPLTRSDMAGYYYEISRVDHFVGEVMKELKAQGVTDNTYVVFTSDNGRPFPRCKTRMYDSGTKIPLIVAGPGIGAISTSALTSTIDIAPSVLGWVGLPIPEEVQGVSFLPTLENSNNHVREILFSEHNWHIFQSHERMVRWKDWLYIRNSYPERMNLAGESTRVFDAGRELWDAHEKGLLNSDQQDVFMKPRPREELYNIKKDPYQFNNKALEEEDSLDFMRRALDQWIEQTGDSKPATPRTDREDEFGNKRKNMVRGEKPGESTGAVNIHHQGPVRTSDIQ